MKIAKGIGGTVSTIGFQSILLFENTSTNPLSIRKMENRKPKSAGDFLVARFCVIGDVTVSGWGDMGLLVDCCVGCVRNRERNLETKVETVKQRLHFGTERQQNEIFSSRGQSIAHRRKHNGQPANPDGEVCEAEKCCDVRCEAGEKASLKAFVGERR